MKVSCKKIPDSTLYTGAQLKIDDALTSHVHEGNLLLDDAAISAPEIVRCTRGFAVYRGMRFYFMVDIIYYFTHRAGAVNGRWIAPPCGRPMDSSFVRRFSARVLF